jgi:aryl-alcohol dehydrogenase-like predicted oxidoreductase
MKGVVGEAVEPFRDEVVIATKFGWNIDLKACSSNLRSTVGPSRSNTSPRRRFAG